MGVRGLFTFIDSISSLSKPYELSDTPVIIDGNNLKHFLYNKYNVDCIYGGDYYEYAAAIRDFFYTLLHCKINPIVIFDGGHDRSERKTKTILERSKLRLIQTSKIFESGECSGNVQPINSQEVLRSVFTEMGITFAQCDFEADGQIPFLANHYKCPVLSDDSDFCIFNIRNGFIRLSSIEPVAETKTINGVKHNYINCKIYLIDNFLSHFPGIDENMLPLFGTLVGNDFADTKSFNDFFRNIGLCEPMYQGSNAIREEEQFIGLLNWLRKFSLVEAIDQVLSHFEESRRAEVKFMIQQSVDNYKAQKCNLSLLIDGQFRKFEEILMKEGKLTTQCDQPLPTPFIISFHKGELPPFFLNIIHLHRTMLAHQAENNSLESSYACSREIRQVIYGFLLQHATTNIDSHNKYCCSDIQEIDRRYKSPDTKITKPIFRLANGNTLPDLCDVYSMDKSRLQNIISLVLDTEISHISSVPRNLQLLFACINYWLKNCYLVPEEEFVYALVINLIYFNYILQRPLLNEKNKACEKVSISIGKETIILDAEDISVTQNLEKYLRKPTFDKSWFRRIVHCYSELQTCILYSMYLNMLLDRPFDHPKLHESFSGTLLYNLTKELICCQDPDVFVADLLGRKPALIKIFNLLKTRILDKVPPERCERINDPFHQVKGKKKKRHTLKTENVSENALSMSNKFEGLSTSE